MKHGAVARLPGDVFTARPMSRGQVGKAVAPAALALWVVSGAAWGQDVPPLRGQLYLPPGILIGSSRMIAMGGAYVGVGEGVAGIGANLASIAHRTPTEVGGFNLAPVFVWMLNGG